MRHKRNCSNQRYNILIEKLTRIIASWAVITCGVGSLSAQLLYKVEAPWLETPSYLFGTHHAVPLSVLDSVPQWRSAFDNCSMVVGEIDMSKTNQIMVEAERYMTAPGDSVINSVIPRDTYNRIAPVFEEYTGINLLMLNTMRPMVAENVFEMAVTSRYVGGFDPEQQLDKYFQTEGRKQKKKVIPLEKALDQAKILYDGISIADQATGLVKLLEDPKKAISDLQETLDAYTRQDIARIYGVGITTFNNHTEAMLDILLTRRNNKWMEKLPGIFDKGSAFVAVGAMHLFGGTGLIEQLRAKGYVVTPMKD